MRQVLSTALVALVVGVFGGGTVGLLAQAPEGERATQQAVTPAAGINADKVDGKHAVGARATRAQRAGKLVATNSLGLLPGNIVKPKWGLIQEVPLGFADGVDDVGYVSATQPATYNAASGVKVSAFADTPIGTDVELTIVPEAGRHLEVDGEFFWRGPEDPGGPYPDLPAGFIRHEIGLINSDFATPVSFKVRVRVFNSGIAPAAFEKAVEKVRVMVARTSDRD
jgi:hypothetical protein